MNRIKFQKIESGLEYIPPMVYTGGLLAVNYLKQENVIFIVDIKSGMCLDYIKVEKRSKDLKKLKNLLETMGVKFEKEMRKRI